MRSASAHRVRFLASLPAAFLFLLAGSMASHATSCPATIGQVPPNTSPERMIEIAKCCWGSGEGCKEEATKTPLTCEQLELMFSVSRINAAAPSTEATAALELWKKKCTGNTQGPAIEPPQGTPPAPPKYANGRFRGERGYYTHYSGAKRQICQPFYSFTMDVRDGQAQFSSGGHTWTGIVDPNGNIRINEDGVYPRPKNTTAIIGPVEDASLYNGYCGNGFFRILGPA